MEMEYGNGDKKIYNQSEQKLIEINLINFWIIGKCGKYNKVKK